MLVREGMSDVVLAVGPRHTLREASRAMAARGVGAAVVHDPDGQGIGILTERDVLVAVGSGLDVDSERVADHVTRDLVVATPDWTLVQAAEAMVRGGFRHLVVVEDGDVVGVLSVRDVVRRWIRERAGAATT